MGVWFRGRSALLYIRQTAAIAAPQAIPKPSKPVPRKRQGFPKDLAWSRREAVCTGCPGFQELDMNKHNFISAFAIAASLLASATACAGPQAQVTEITVDCQTRALPSQAEVGSMLGIDNFSATYAARSRLMVDVARACQRRGIEQVRVSLAPSVGAGTRASLASAGRVNRR
jgi:hypothetical protein